MDPRRIDLNRRHSRETSLLFQHFIESRPDLDVGAYTADMSAEQEAAWSAYSAEVLARHQAERVALAAELKAEERRS